MKFFLGLDVTQDDNNNIYDGEEFIVQRASEEQTDALGEAASGYFDTIFNYKTPFYIRFFEIVSGLATLVSCVAVIALLEDESISQAYAKASWLFYTFGLGIFIFVLSVLIDHKRRKNTVESEENTYKFSKVEAVSENIYAELGVPADAPEVEILSVRYAYGYNDEIVLKKQRYYGMVTGPAYDNFAYKLFVRDNTLFVADTEAKYAIPISEIRAIRTINEKIAVSSWLKDEPYSKGKYKEYKIRENDNGDIAFKPYHILELEHNGEIWGIYFPCYELPIIESLTGLKAE